jgi:glycosyltransferase involved in cell wall biosynthesis
MKVLIVSVFHPELTRGGAQQVAYELFEGLQQTPGVEPVFLAAVDPSMSAFYKSGARITGFDGRPNEFLFLTQGYDGWWHKNGSPILLESFAEFLRLVKPDVVHFHHFLLLGFDLLTLTRRVLPDARIIFTFHEFLTICAADGQMVRRVDGSLCDRASPARCHQCFPQSPPETFFVREMWFKKHLSVVDAFTTPSRFMIDHYVRWGIDPAKISCVANGQRDYGQAAPRPSRPRRNRFGFFGQLVDNKGVQVMLRAVQILRQEGFTDFSVEINGANLVYASEPIRQEIEAFREQEEALPAAEQLVRFNGSYHLDQLSHRMARVDWCLAPSIWWESFGLVISEAWMFGKPVIASNVGGMAERIGHEVDGLLFEVGDARALAETIRRAATEEGLWDRLAKGITPPPARGQMVEGYMALYAGDTLLESDPLLQTT